MPPSSRVAGICSPRPRIGRGGRQRPEVVKTAPTEVVRVGEHLLGGLLGRQRGRVEPPAELAEGLAHRRHERLVAAEEELLLRVAELVAAMAHGATRVEHDERQVTLAEALDVEVELGTVGHDPVDDGREAGVGEARRQPDDVVVAESGLAVGFFGGLTEGPDNVRSPAREGKGIAAPPGIRPHGSYAAASVVERARDVRSWWVGDRSRQPDPHGRRRA